MREGSAMNTVRRLKKMVDEGCLANLQLSPFSYPDERILSQKKRDRKYREPLPVTPEIERYFPDESIAPLHADAGFGYLFVPTIQYYLPDILPSILVQAWTDYFQDLVREPVPF